VLVFVVWTYIEGVDKIADAISFFIWILQASGLFFIAFAVGGFLTTWMLIIKMFTNKKNNISEQSETRS
jgi:hypothetical protein